MDNQQNFFSSWVSEYIRNYHQLHLSELRKGFSSGSSGAGEVGGVPFLLQQLPTLPIRLSRRLHVQVDWAPGIGAAVGKHRLHAEPIKAWQLCTTGTVLAKAGRGMLLERSLGTRVSK